jgi:hypothetical protein
MKQKKENKKRKFVEIEYPYKNEKNDNEKIDPNIYEVTSRHLNFH